MKKIDVDTWIRKDVFNFYKDMDLPRYQITVDFDVTAFYAYVKQEKLSFYFSVMWLILNEMNQIDNFKYRFVDEKPVLFDLIHPSFTDKLNDGETFKLVRSDFLDDIKSFCALAIETSNKQGAQFIDLSDEARQDLVYVSTFLWAKFTHATNVSNIDSKDAVPRIGWGKFEEENGKLMMPINIEVHHAFVDGFHVGKLFQNIQKALQKYE